ncbi:urease accessory protein [Geodermatophilus sp. TF02-6]|nr:urease accessory protein [Geodermatophilus sp. TF02-6]
MSLAAFLGCLQLTDSAFPSGRYTQSSGLESFVQHGYVTADSGRQGLTALLVDQLEHAVGPTDGVALAWAHRAVSRRAPGQELDLALAVEADQRLTAVKLAREVRESSTRTGRSLLRTATTVFGGAALEAFSGAVRSGATPGNAAVVTGVLMAQQGIPTDHAVAAELYAYAAGWVNAAVRLGVADHRVAQAVLHAGRPVVERTGRLACRTALADMAGSTPLADLMSMRHEHAPLRLFMS